jgi:hypothetical protein
MVIGFVILITFAGVFAWFMHEIRKWHFHLEPAVQNMSEVEKLIREIRQAPDDDWRSEIADAYNKLDSAEKVIDAIPSFFLNIVETPKHKCTKDDVDVLRDTLDKYNSMYSGI